MSFFRRTAQEREIIEKKRAERKEEQYIRTTQAEEAAKEERRKQAVETAVYRERQRGHTTRQPKQGGWMSSLISTPTRGVSRRRKTTRYIKTGKGKYRKETFFKTISPSQQPQLSMSQLFSASTKKKKNRGMIDFKF